MSVFEDPPKPFLRHLSELRTTLLGGLAAWAAGIAIMVPLAPRLFALIIRPLERVAGGTDPFLRSLDVTGGFAIALRLVLWGGLLLGAPIITALIGRFVFPGLTRMERRIALLAAGAAAGLFAAGVGVGYWITLPVALRIMLSLHAWLGIRAEWTAVSYATFAVRLLLLFGLSFQLPIVLVALGAAGLARSSFLRAKRRHAVVAILVLAMVLTPGPDVFSQVIMAGPMLALYEACIWVIWLIERRRARAGLAA